MMLNVRLSANEKMVGQWRHLMSYINSASMLMVLHVRSVSGHSTEKHFDFYYQNIVIELYLTCCYMTFLC